MRSSAIGAKDARREGRIRESWDANAAAWTDAVRGGRIESRRLGTDAAIIDAARAWGMARVLDVGCGEGWLARALTPHGLAVVGVDGSEELIVAARQLGGGTFHVMRYESMSTNLESLGGPFDLVCFNFALLARDIRRPLAAVLRVLAPEGKILIQTTHPFVAVANTRYEDGWREESFHSFGDEFCSPMPYYFRTFASWLYELHAVGLAVIDCVEPLDPETGRPLSLLLVARSAPLDRGGLRRDLKRTTEAGHATGQ
jgi:SAM-dependent methyltransferase